MTKHELEKKTEQAVNETRAALQTVYDALNHGQQKQIVKDEAVKGMLPKTRLGEAILKNLKVYAGAEHPHAAQCPKEIKLNEIK